MGNRSERATRTPGSIARTTQFLFSRLTGAAGIYFAASIIARGAAFFLIPLYTRRLSLEDYGEYALAQTLIQLLGTPLSLGLLSAVTRFFYEEDAVAGHRRVGDIARWIVVISLSGATVLELLLWSFWPAGGHGFATRESLSLIIVAGAFTAVSGIPSGYLRAAQRPLAAAAFQIGDFFLNVGLGIFLVAVLGRGVRGAIEAAACAATVSGCVALVYVTFALKGSLDRKTLRDGVKFSLPFVPHVAANQLQQMSDRWTMKWTGLGVALGGYALAGQLATPVVMALLAWNDASSPQMGEMSRARGMRGVATAFKNQKRSYAIAVALPAIGLILALRIIVSTGHFIGANFVSSLWLVPFFCAAYVTDSLYYPSSNVIFFANRPKLIPPITILSGIIGIALNVILIPRFGVVGALVARFATSIVRSTAMWMGARFCFARAFDREDAALAPADSLDGEVTNA